MPTRDTAWPPGTPCWIDYAAADVDAAQAFYADLLGWTYTPGDEQYGGYRSCLSDGRQAAGMMPAMQGQPPAWTTYFATDDAEAACAAVARAGGSVVSAPMQVGPLGSMAIALDPQGAAFGVWQAGTHTGTQVYNQPGAVVWNDESVADPDAARAFYAAVFGFHFDTIEGMDGYTTFATDGGPLGGIGPRQEGGPQGWSTCFAVASADDAVVLVEKAGGQVVTPVQDTAYGRFAAVRDPWGAPLSFMQVTATA